MDRTAEWEGPMASEDGGWLPLDIRRRAGQGCAVAGGSDLLPQEGFQVLTWQSSHWIPHSPSHCGT